MVKVSPLKELHEVNGAVFSERDGWLLPRHFGRRAGEYAAVRARVGLVDLAHRGIFSLSGPDAFSYLQGMISNDLRNLTAGQALYAMFLNVHGKVLADVRVLSTGDLFLLDLWEPLKDKILVHLNRYLVADEVEIADLTDRCGLLSVQGSQSRNFMKQLLGTDDIPAGEAEHRLYSVDGAEIRVVRWSGTGEEGYDFIVGSKDIVAFAARLQESGRDISPVWVGEEALELLRVEAGIPRYGSDFDENQLLLETGLEQAVSFRKGCYLGQEVVERIRSRGHVNKKLGGLILEGEKEARRGDAVTRDGKEVGVVTSSIVSPALRRPVALAYLHRAHWTPGTRVTVARDGASLQGVVSPLPFVAKSAGPARAP